MRFCISDVFLPSSEELLVVPANETEIEGTILDFSDSGPRPQIFAVVEVINRHTVVVPTEKLSVIGPAPSGEV